MANVSRETVSRALHALIKQGIIDKDSRKLIVKNPQVLFKLVRGELSPEELGQREAQKPSPERAA